MSARYRLAYAAAIVVALVLGGGLVFGEAATGFMLGRLSHERHLAEPASADGGAVYVLGGTPDSLEHKFETAARLLRERKADRILVLSREGLMAFSPARNRNLTANEWATEKLAAFGAPADRIEFVVLEEGFFGTWSEAEGLSRLARERGFQRLLLVTSAYHSRRVWESFSRKVEQPDRRLFLYQSDEPASLRLLLAECLKLFFYRSLLF